MPTRITRRNALKLAGAGAAAGALTRTGLQPASARPRAARQDVHEIVHWSWLDRLRRRGLAGR